MVNQKHIIGILLALVIVCATISIVDTVSAAKYKKIDSYKYKDGSGVSKVTTYYNGKTVKVNSKFYLKNKKTNKYTKLSETMDMYLTKVSKNKLKMVIIDKEVCKKHGSHTHKDIEYRKTSLSAKSYYTKVLKPLMK